MTSPKEWLLVSVGTYLVAMPMESFCIGGECHTPSYTVLIMGWLGALSAPISGNITWLANPILYLAWLFILFSARPMSIWTSILALMIGASFMLAKTVMTNEGGVYNPVTGYAIGYWLWLASMIIACRAAFDLPNEQSRHKSE